MRVELFRVQDVDGFSDEGRDSAGVKGSGFRT